MTPPSNLDRATRSSGDRPSAHLSTVTHHFRRDVGVRQASVLTHDGQVAVDVDGQRVARQHHDAADTSETHKYTCDRHEHLDTPEDALKGAAAAHPFSPLLMNF